jgi:CRP-like cAMP-binding protein
MNFEFKKLLREEAGGVKISDELFERLIGSTTEIHLKNKEVLITYGKVDTNLYILKSGVLRACYFVGDNEITYGFADPGSIAISYHAHFWHKPSVFQIESCGESTVLKITKQQLDELLNSSLEFARWLLAIRAGQLCFNEFKLTTIAGEAKERFRWMLQHRPNVLAVVPAKTIASYLGITQTHLSRLKKSLSLEK